MADQSLTDTPPIACTFGAGDFQERLRWIAALNAASLRAQKRDDLTLTLTYAATAREEVWKMVRGEQACCAFLTFDVREEGDEVRVTIAAPESAREAADTVFAPFVSLAAAQSGCGCGGAAISAGEVKTSAQPPSRFVGPTAAIAGLGAAACAVCCVLPFALPAAILATAGGGIALFARLTPWAILAALVAVIAAWSWVALQTARTKRRPAASTLSTMGIATLFLGVALAWPIFEGTIIRSLRPASSGEPASRQAASISQE